jgi:acetolactate synthase-1/2/3 large subunit
MEWDSLVRHEYVHVVSVIGNNRIWALEKHPMGFIWLFSGGELRPSPLTRWSRARHGELV